MKAILIENDEKKSLVWKEVPDPVCKEGYVVIQVKAAALNRADLLQRAGLYPPPPGWPEWMGLECSGVICETMPSSRWKVGDKVCALLGGGAYAEKALVPEDMVIPMPEGLDFVQSAAIPEAFATSYLNLFLEADLKEGECVFIPAGASGLGIAAIQLAKAFGAKVMTTVSSAEKAEFVRELGADIVLNRKTDDIVKAFQETPVHVAMDCAGGELLGQCLAEMAVGGRWILIATLGGVNSNISLRPLLKKGVTLKGSTLRSRSNGMKALILSQLVEKVYPLIAQGTIRPLIHAVLPMTEAEKAHEILQNQTNMGKVVLTLE